MIAKYVYLVLSLGITVYLIRKHRPQHPLVSLLVCLWIFVSDLANTPEFIIKIPGAPFELQPLRTLLLSFLGFLFLKTILDRYRRKSLPKEVITSVRPRYEIYLEVYMVILLVSYVVHYNLLGAAEFVVLVSAALSFYIIYMTVKKTADPAMVRMIQDAIITVAVVSSLVAVVQLLVDSSFLRIQPSFSRPAFAGLLRSTGVFRDDYVHAYVVIVGLIWTLFTVANGFKKAIIIGILMIGILFGFMRMGYVVIFVVLVHYFYFMYRGNAQLKLLLVVISVIVTVVGIGWIITSGIMESSVAQERMLDEGTTEIRGRLYLQAVESSTKSIKSFLFGYGTLEHPEYYNAMYKVTDSYRWATGEVGGWHNLYLETLFFHGVVAMVFLVVFLCLATAYFYKLGVREDSTFFIPFYCLLSYLIANLSLGLPIYSNFGVLVGITCALALSQRKERLNQQLPQPEKNAI
jgi:hypothetical protein